MSRSLYIIPKDSKKVIREVRLCHSDTQGIPKRAACLMPNVIVCVSPFAFGERVAADSEWRATSFRTWKWHDVTICEVGDSCACFKLSVYISIDHQESMDDDWIEYEKQNFVIFVFIKLFVLIYEWNKFSSCHVCLCTSIVLHHFVLRSYNVFV